MEKHSNITINTIAYELSKDYAGSEITHSGDKWARIHLINWEDEHGNIPHVRIRDNGLAGKIVSAHLGKQNIYPRELHNIYSDNAEILAWIHGAIDAMKIRFVPKAVDIWELRFDTTEKIHGIEFNVCHSDPDYIIRYRDGYYGEILVESRRTGQRFSSGNSNTQPKLDQIFGRNAWKKFKDLHSEALNKLGKK